MSEFDDFGEQFNILKSIGWYDPYTREEAYVCKALKYFGSDTKNIAIFDEMVNEILITNNVFLTLRSLKSGDNFDNILKKLSTRLSASRIEELCALTSKDLSV